MGLREGEVLGLTWANVKLDERKMYITQAVQFLPGKGVVVTPLKTDASKRGLPIPGTVYQALVQHQAMFPSEGFIFATANNTPISDGAMGARENAFVTDRERYSSGHGRE